MSKAIQLYVLNGIAMERFFEDFRILCYPGTFTCLIVPPGQGSSGIRIGERDNFMSPSGKHFLQVNEVNPATYDKIRKLIQITIFLKNNKDSLA